MLTEVMRKNRRSSSTCITVTHAAACHAGDKKVGLFSASDGEFHIIEDLRPRYIVPDLSSCTLRPYVSHYKPPTPGK